MVIITLFATTEVGAKYWRNNIGLTMAEICPAKGLSQSNVADRASVSLADDRQNAVQVTVKSKFRKNTLEELRRKRLRRNQTRKDKIRKMSRKEKRAFFKHKATKDLVKTHNEEITQMKNLELEAKRKAVFFWRKWKTAQLPPLSQRDHLRYTMHYNKQEPCSKQ